MPFTRRTLLGILATVAVMPPAITAAPSAVTQTQSDVCSIDPPRPMSKAIWGQELVTVNPIHAEVNTKTGDVKYYFEDGRQMIVNVKDENRPIPSLA